MRNVKRKAPWYGHDSTAHKNPSTYDYYTPKTAQGGINNSGECLRNRTKEVDDVKGVFRIEAFHQLPLVVAVGKQTKVPS